MQQEWKLSGPLSGLRVVDITAGLAGAYAARLLADLGAQVVRLADTRSLARRLTPSRQVPDWEPGLHRVLNAGKETVALDPITPDGRRDLHALLSDARLLVEDVGLMDSALRPLAWDALHGAHPALTALSLSPFGLSGPDAHSPASDLSLWARAGLAWTTPGIPDTPTDLPKEPPLAPTGVSVAGLIGGVVAAVAALATLFGGRPTAQGSRVEVSELEALVALNYHPIAQFEYLRRLWPRGPNIIARQPNCYVPCKDGWLVLVAMSPQHWGELVGAMGRPDWAESEAFVDGPARAANWDALEPLLLEWTRAHTGREITAELQRRGLPVYWAATLREAVDSDQVRVRDFLRAIDHPDDRHPVRYPGLPFILSDFPRSTVGGADDFQGAYPSVSPGAGEALGGSDPQGLPSPSGGSQGVHPLGGDRRLPLAGLRVVDFGQYIAVPFAARWLAALGADVVQIESRQNPFDYRNVPPFADDVPGLNRAAGYNVLNAGKRSVALNLRTEKGRDIARRIAAKSDVLMENYSTGTMDKWGLGYGDLSALNPRLVYTSVAAFGRTGPLKDYGGLHSIVNAFSGLADVTGYHGGHPRLLGSYFPDVVSGAYAVLATLAALHHRERTEGRGQYVDLAMTEAMMTLLPEPLLAMAAGTYRPSREGSRHPLHAPHNVYPAQGDDQWLAVAVRTDDEWLALCQVIARLDLAHDARYRTAADRKRNENALDQVLREWTSQRDKRQAAAALVGAGVPAAPVLDPQELVADPHLVERGFLAPTDHPEIGPRVAAGLPWRVDGALAGDERRPAPLVGQYTAAILQDILGLSQTEIDSLAAEGVLT